MSEALPPLPEPVAHVHSNGEFCADRQIQSESWPVDLITVEQAREYGALCARQERERAALCCEDLATLMEWGAGDPEPGGRLRQAARNIRSGKEPVQYAQYGPGAALEDSHE
jgi:hypothetical protein